jgi:hypothetical protein
MFSSNARESAAFVLSNTALSRTSPERGSAASTRRQHRNMTASEHHTRTAARTGAARPASRSTIKRTRNRLQRRQKHAHASEASSAVVDDTLAPGCNDGKSIMAICSENYTIR